MPPPAVQNNTAGMRAVKHHHLQQIVKLDIASIAPQAITIDDVDAACSAAKSIRARIVREYERVQSQVQRIKQNLYHDRDSGGSRLRQPGGGVDEDDDGIGGADGPIGGGPLLQHRLRAAVAAAIREDQTFSLLRSEYTFLGELKTVERIVVPVLLAHALRYPDTLLPQLLKLLAAMTLPPIADVADLTTQEDVLHAIRARCSVDEFFTLIIHAVAPIASRRKDGPLPYNDAALLEIVLSLLSNLLRGSVAVVEPTVGAMCRNHGVELVLVLLTQNFEKHQSLMTTQTVIDTAMSAAEKRFQNDEMQTMTETEQTDTDRVSETAMVTLDNDKDVVVAVDDSTPSLEHRLQATTANNNNATMMARAETQLVVLPDSQYEAFLLEEEEKKVAQQHDPQQQKQQRFINNQHSTVVDAVLRLEDDDNDALVVIDGQDMIVLEDDGDVIEFDWNARSGAVPAVVEDDDDEEHPKTSGGVKKAEVVVPSSDSSDESSAPSESDDEEDEEGSDEEEGEDDEEEESDEEEVVDPRRRTPTSVTRPSARITELAEEFQRESLESLRRLNDYLLEIVALVFRCAPAADLSMLALSLQGAQSLGASNVMASIQALRSKVTSELKHQQRIEDSWRQIAKSRNGALHTNSIMIRKHPNRSTNRHDDAATTTVAVSVLGPTATLMMGGRQADTLGSVKELDRRKRGRFNKKMLEPPAATSVLPLPTQMHLAQQFATFLAHGFENLSIMLWPRISVECTTLHDEIEEAASLGASYVNDGPMISPLANTDLKEVMNYFFLCGTLLRFTRINLTHVLEWRREIEERNKAKYHQDNVNGGGGGDPLVAPQVSLYVPEGGSFSTSWGPGAGEQAQSQTANTSAPVEDDMDPQQKELLMTFEAQWKAVSHILTLEHIQVGFTLIHDFTVNKELAAEYDVGVPVALVAELVLLLVHLLDGDIVKDAAVTMAAHAMGSSILYREENIACVYQLVGNVNFRSRPSPGTVQSVLLLLHALLTLIEKCSFNGSLALPKKAPRARKATGAGDDINDVDEEEEAGDDEYMMGNEQGAIGQVRHEAAADRAFVVDDDEDVDVDDTESENVGERLNNPSALADAGGIGNEEEEVDGDAMMQRLREEEFRAKERLLQGLLPPSQTPTDGGVETDPDDQDIPLQRREAEDDDDEVSLHGDDYNTVITAAAPALRLGGGADEDEEGQREHAAADERQETDEEQHERHDDEEERSQSHEDVLYRAKSQESEESASIVLSSRTGNTSITSEREVRVQDFYIRLSTPKYIPVMYYGLMSWRHNDGDVNIAICAVLNNLLARSSGITSFYSFPFLLIFHDILAPTSGAIDTHRPLYDVADRIVYQFFNPSFVVQTGHPLYDAQAQPGDVGVVGKRPTIGGSNSELGLAVALRCSRALFQMNPSHYSVLDDALLPQAVGNDIDALDDDAAASGRRRRGKKRATFAGVPVDEAEEDDPLGFDDMRDDDEEEYQLPLAEAVGRDDVLVAPAAGKSRASRTTKRARAGADSKQVDTGASRTTTRTRRRGGAAALGADDTNTYVMNSTDVTEIAKQVDRRERKQEAEANRKSRKRAATRTSSDEDDEGERKKKSAAKKDKKDKKSKNKDKDKDEGDDNEEGKKRKHKKRHRHEKHPRVVAGDEGPSGDHGASMDVGSIIHGEDGATYIVQDDGYAYRAEWDPDTEAYRLQQADDNDSAAAAAPQRQQDAEHQEDSDAHRYRQQEDERTALLQHRQHIDAPHSMDTPQHDAPFQTPS